MTDQLKPATVHKLNADGSVSVYTFEIPVKEEIEALPGETIAKKDYEAAIKTIPDVEAIWQAEADKAGQEAQTTRDAALATLEGALDADAFAALKTVVGIK